MGWGCGGMALGDFAPRIPHTSTFQLLRYGQATRIPRRCKYQCRRNGDAEHFHGVFGVFLVLFVPGNWTLCRLSISFEKYYQDIRPRSIQPCARGGGFIRTYSHSPYMFSTPMLTIHHACSLLCDTLRVIYGTSRICVCVGYHARDNFDCNDQCHRSRNRTCGFTGSYKHAVTCVHNSYQRRILQMIVSKQIYYTSGRQRLKSGIINPWNP